MEGSNFIQENFDIDIKEELIEADEQENVDKNRLELKDIIVSLGNNEESDSTSKEPLNEAEIIINPEIRKKSSNHRRRPLNNSEIFLTGDRNVLASNSSSNKPRRHDSNIQNHRRQKFDHLIQSPAEKPPNKQYSHAIFDKWSKGTCVFQCKLCTYLTGDSMDFWKHVKDKHNMQMETYKVFRDPSPCIVSNQITCKLCQKEIQFDYKTLLKHVNAIHNTKLLDFYQKFYQEEVERKYRSGMERTPSQDVKIENFGISSTSNSEDTSVIIYCLCRKPERPGMIGCDYCDEWFHPDCLKLSKNEVKTLTECQWMCPKCELKDNKSKGIFHFIT